MNSQNILRRSHIVFMMLLLFVATLPAMAQVGSSLRNDDGSIVLANPVFEMWAAELDAGLRLTPDPIDSRRFLVPLGVHGLNGAGFSLYHLSDTGKFFAPDGRSCDPEAAEQFKRFIMHTHEHGFITVAALFSATGHDGLASPEAYRQAVQTIARSLPAKHFVILVPADLFGKESVFPACPYPLDRTDKVLELCRLMFQANPTVVVGLPGQMVTGLPLTKDSDPFFYATTNMEALEKVISEPSHNDKSRNLPPEVAAVNIDHFFCRNHAGHAGQQTLDRYLESVRKKLCSIYVPGPESTKPVSDHLLTAEEKKDGFVALFDGQSLKEWTTLLPSWGRWTLKDKAIYCQAHGYPRPWLRSRKSYTSFILRLDYKLAAHGNSGVFIWAPLNARASGLGMEIQLFYSEDKVVNDSMTTGAIYKVLPPREDAARPPGQWNELEITCRGTWVQIRLNGRTVQDFDAEKVPGLRNRLRSGVIGLQDHGHDVWFRNIRIKELPEDNTMVKP